MSQGGAPALSQDGRFIAYVVDGPSGRQIWVQSVGAFDARPLIGTDGAASPFWSPDGLWIGFVAAQTLKKVAVTGGQPQQVGRSFPFGLGAAAGTWNQTDTILFYGGRNNTLASVSAAGGEPVQATERNVSLFDENHQSPSFLPDGRHYLLLVRGGPDLQYQVWVGQVGSNSRTLLLRDVTNAHYAPPRSRGPGHLVYVRERMLMAQPFDAATLTLAGTPAAIAEDVAMSASGGFGDFALSANGILAYRRVEPGKQEIASFDRTGKPIGTLGDRAGNPRSNLRVSPDGKWVAFTRMGETSQDIWIANLASGDASRVTFDGGRSPVWSPDGTQLAFLRQDTIYRKPLTNGGAEEAIWRGPGTLALTDWSGDGRFLLLTRWDTSKPGLSGRGLWLLPYPLAPGQNRTPTLFEADALHGQFGPRTGPPRWVAFDAFDGSTRQIFVRTMPGMPQGKWQVSSVTGNTSRWRADGRELFFLSNGSLTAVAVDPSAPFQVRMPHLLFAGPPAFGTAAGQYSPGWDTTPDGERFLTTFPAQDAPARAITIVMNWDTALESR
jgi:Tol biopolymer transport system component